MNCARVTVEYGAEETMHLLDQSCVNLLFAR
jgi:hypothetical protein